MELNAKRLQMLTYEFKSMLDDATATIANLKVLLKEKDAESKQHLENIGHISQELQEAREKLLAYEEGNM